MYPGSDQSLFASPGPWKAPQEVTWPLLPCTLSREPGSGLQGGRAPEHRLAPVPALMPELQEPQAIEPSRAELQQQPGEQSGGSSAPTWLGSYANGLLPSTYPGVP